MEPKPSPGHQRLITELKRLRESKGLSGQRLGRQLAWSQSKVSKIENGRTRPSEADVEVWARACGAPANAVSDLVALASSIMTEARAWSSPRHGTLTTRNRAIGDAEARVTRLQNFQPAVIPGLLQTAEYARRVISMVGVSDTEDVASAAAARIERQSVLYHQSRRFEFLLTEAALRWRPGPPPLMLAQLDRLVSLQTLPNVLIGVVPYGREAVALQTNGFTIFEVPEDPFVLVETLTRELFLHDESDLVAYQDCFARMRDVALTGLPAVSAIRTVMAEVASD